MFLPDWIERIRQRTDGLTDDVLALLLDAQQCLDHLYIRPAIVVMGVAYEVAVERVIEQLIGHQ
ncbi:MAG TPA: hypothetical protein VHN14_11915 [Kofleriaceae bacterium]|jgi:hypothetical protein|nr:hypothetical protein [Kofleriaceae bacterium]